MLIESMADGGVKNGLPRDVALRLAAQTVYGAAKMTQGDKRLRLPKKRFKFNSNSIRSYFILFYYILYSILFYFILWFSITFVYFVTWLTVSDIRNDSSRHPAQLRNAVESPGGTTIAGGEKTIMDL